MLENYHQQLLENTIKLVKIPSVYTEGESHPLGNANFKCAEEVVKLMDSLGFKTYMDPEGYYVYAEVGEGELFGVLGHMDVVPAHESEGWVTPPFDPKVIDGVLYGRGVQDDKGPTLASIYAVKALMDEGYEFKYKIRFIFGFNEETDWKCINKYKENEEAPVIGFTPDSAFPVVYAEKGLMQFVFTKEEKVTYKVEGGSSFNAVPSKASCKNEEAIRTELINLGYAYMIEDDKIVVQGKSAHAKNPWKGDSAIYKLCETLEKAGVTDDTVKFVNEHLSGKDRFEGFTTLDLSDFSGPVSINLGQLFLNEDGARLNLDIRHPVTVKPEEIVNILNRVGNEHGYTVTEKEIMAPIYLPLDSEFISSMIETYREVTGDNEAEPMISGGATYARAFENCVAFGPNFQHIPSSEHMPNEGIKVEQLNQVLEIYYRFIKKFCVK